MTTTIERPPGEQCTPNRDAGMSIKPFPVGRLADIAATMLTGLFAGFFGTYSFSVVRGLAIVDDVTYVQTFQGINATIKNAEFALVFFGVVPAIVLALATNRNDVAMRKFLRIAGLFFAVSVVGVTFIGNVPLNDELALVDGTSVASAQGARADFEDTWNLLNLIRTGLSAMAFGCLVVLQRLDR